MIHASAEFKRIAAMPRRDPSALMTAAYVDAVTSVLRLQSGGMTTRPIQAAALVEMARRRGALLPMGVGSGKTLVTFLAPTVLAAERSVLCVPGGLVEKTERDFAKLRSHWKETPLTLVSYEKLGRSQWADMLELLRPQLLVLDECQAVRNRDGAACARVIEAYYDKYRPMVVALSGTITGGSLLHYAHIAKWCLGERNTFLPVDWYELDLWRRAVDAECEAGARVAPGVLLELVHDREPGDSKMKRARAAVRRRMIETEGVIRTTESGVDASLRLSIYATLDDVVPASVWEGLRAGVLPNGQEVLDGLEGHRHARELACGYYSIWDPSPPTAWVKARRRWAKCVRKGINERWCNTEVEARTRCEDWGVLRFRTADLDGLTKIETIDPVEARDAWLLERDMPREDGRPYKPNPVPVWLSTVTLDAAAAWARKQGKAGGIIWTQHVPFGVRLEKDYGIPFFREKGFSRGGVYIEDASGVICASVSANATGRNLQERWSANLIVSPFSSGEKNEQMLGRTHRPGQTQDAVTAETLVACVEHVRAIERARVRAEAIEQLADTPQKLCYCDWLVELDGYRKRPGKQWESSGVNDNDADAVEDLDLEEYAA